MMPATYRHSMKKVKRENKQNINNWWNSMKGIECKFNVLRFFSIGLKFFKAKTMWPISKFRVKSHGNSEGNHFKMILKDEICP